MAERNWAQCGHISRRAEWIGQESMNNLNFEMNRRFSIIAIKEEYNFNRISIKVVITKNKILLGT